MNEPELKTYCVTFKVVVDAVSEEQAVAAARREVDHETFEPCEVECFDDKKETAS